MKFLRLNKNKSERTTSRKKLSKSSKKIETWNYSSTTINPYLRDVLALKETIPEWDDFFNSEKPEERGNNWIRLEILGQPLCEKYSWAIPDQRALNIIAQFQPIIEVGAGNGYWAHLLRKQNVHIRCCDNYVNYSTLWTLVEKSGPMILQQNDIIEKHYTLMLCYPDEASDLSYQCLQYYEGEYIIHIGELAMTGTCSGFPQAPFGRTTNSQFQIELMEHFHCILLAELPRFPFSKDYISVWKRSRVVPGKNNDNDNEEGSDNESSDNEGSSDGEEEEDEDEEQGKGTGKDYWVDIPPQERLVWDNAIPSLAHLLQ